MKKLNKLTHQLNKIKAKYRIIASSHLKELEKEIEDLNIQGKIKKSFYDQYLSNFQFSPSGYNFNTFSVIVIAIPQRISLVAFHLNNRVLKTVIPPTYIYKKVRNSCCEILSGIFGYNNISRAFLPVKLLATRSGLGKYGRNNICYINGMGSFARIEAFFINQQLDRDDWQHKKMIEMCKECYQCAENCPTKCIKTAGFIIDAENCLTYSNEKPGYFSKSLSPTAHNALLGCMQCQLVCPANRSFIKEKSQVESFSEDESKLIINNQLDASLSLKKKLIQLDMEEYKAVLSRNLNALIQ